MDIFHAGVGSNAIYYLYFQGIKAMNQKTAIFVVINTPRRMDVSEPPRDCRRLNAPREYDNENTKLYP